MARYSLDEIDKGILYALQKDARTTTTRRIGDRVDVSASTISNRIDRLEDEGIITSYRTMLDYEQAGFPLHVLVVCSAPITERESLARQALDIKGVVNIRELMAGEQNIRVEAVGKSNDDITRIVMELSELGLVTSSETLIRNQYFRPLAFLETMPNN